MNNLKTKILIFSLFLALSLQTEINKQCETDENLEIEVEFNASTYMKAFLTRKDNTPFEKKGQNCLFALEIVHSERTVCPDQAPNKETFNANQSVFSQRYVIPFTHSSNSLCEIDTTSYHSNFPGANKVGANPTAVLLKLEGFPLISWFSEQSLL